MRNPKDITINGKQLSDILESHRKWLYDEESGERANLSAANLSAADLRAADLRAADLRAADLRAADLRDANLSDADLSDANLRAADLRAADLRDADLRDANLSAADLSDAKNKEMAEAITNILPDGDIIGWKKCRRGLAKLLIPADAKRSNSTGRKCRAEFANVVMLYDMNGNETPDAILKSQHDMNFSYRVGDRVAPTKTFDPNRWEECSTGIHFFITRWEAEHY